jgi:hypothetical protein
MADTKISGLPASTTPLAGTEVLPVVQSGVTRQVSVANLTAGRAVSATQLTLTTENLIVGTSGKGIDFSAAGGDVLSQYDENTWTPTLSRDGSAPTLSYSVQVGSITRVGRLVTVSAHLTFTVTAQGSGNWFVPLPLTVRNLTNYRPTGSAGFSSVFACTGMYGISGGQLGYLVNAGSLVSGNATDGSIMLSITYEV